MQNILTRLKNGLRSFVARVHLAWIKYWTLQRRFAFDHTSVSFRRAFVIFISAVLFVYFVIGLPVLGYFIYAKHTSGVPLAVASVLYPFPVATVGRDTILLKPFSDRLRYLKFFAKQTQQQLPAEPELRQQVINKLIDEAIIRQWANREGITVTNQDIDAAYDKIIKDKGSESDVRTVLSQLYNLNDKEFKRLIPDLLYREKIETTLLERVHVRHILLGNEALAKKVKSEVTPENFVEKAKQHSQDKTTRDSGGDLGFFDRAKAEKLSPELAKIMFELPAGQISEPVKTQYGYHIVHSVEKTGKEAKSFDQWLKEKRDQTKVRRFLK